MATSSARDAAVEVASALHDRRSLRVLGAEGALRGLLLAQAEGPVVFVAPDDATARTVAADTAFFLGRETEAGAVTPDDPILVVPEIDVSPYADLSPDPRVIGARLAALHRLGAHRIEDEITPPKVVITSVRALTRRTMPPGVFAGLCRAFSVGDELPREEAAQALLAAGYLRTEVVEDPGTFAVRGGVMDVFVPLLRFPVRLEWFGDEIERMRLFDPDSQRSLRAIESCAVHPVREAIATTREPLRSRVLALADAINVPTSKSRQVLENLQQGLDFFGIEALTPVFHDGMVPLWEHLPADAHWLVEDPAALVHLAERLEEETRQEHAKAMESLRLVAPPEGFVVEATELRARLDACPVVMTRADLYDPERSDERPVLRVEADANLPLRAALETARSRKGGEILRPLVEHIRRLGRDEEGELRQPWSVILAAPNLTHAERLTSLLRGYGLRLDPPRRAGEAALPLRGPDDGPTRVRVIAGELSAGFSSPGDRLLVLSEADLFGTITRRARPRRRRTGLGSLAQLTVGDYVVHVVHGVGRYAGLIKLALGGVPGDYVQVEYAGSDKLYLPVHRLGEIERYVSAEAKPPRLDKMGGSTFETKKNKVKAEVRQMAEELLQIYAQREALDGHAHPPPDETYAAFESTFPFEETPDQQEAIDAVQADLGRPQPMDRLVCGDVGFGKTEVALRAACRVALGGKQVAVLAPTTVLVQQHFHTFRDRMESFGLVVEHLNRFVSPAERTRIVAGIREGTVDVVVGTHRLLSRDVRFRDLGLLVIDEEQRFGVAQKERFKKLKTKVDVLALSATPIPRTLHMSLLGIREISLIMTPPVDRLAVRTLLTRQSDTVIEEGIRKELARGGQVFYVVPKIMGIEEHAVRIRSLVPEARVKVAHGKMPAELLENTMVEFVEHQADVLVCTTIIESGLDIPRANTMFIARADAFGLSQLYQLRGRIGRSKLRAFCYLMVNALERLSPEAKRRLEALQKYAELGSGFHVASEDLEIRGAGEILGGRQSGQIQAIGFDAYSRILAEAVAELRGQPIVHDTDPEIVFDVPAFLPDTYVEDTGQRLDLYRRLSAARDIDEVDAVMEEIRDRFGDLPMEATHLGFVMACKTYGRALHAQALELRGDRFTIRLGPDTPLSPKVAAELHRKTRGRLSLAGPDRIALRLPESTGRRREPQLRACQEALAELASLARAA
ncbi:MAG: transcription-repair coupling factor [Myxococcales bacterium]|nr:transcription-repair coupling factor [Myxococcales bacterium]MCB9719011.1 transcription-repair coupling factor [Myxococcales bacterium]